jgi:hypothetical protein
MKAYGGVDVETHIFLTLALAGGEWSASRPGRFTPGGRASLDNVEKKKFLNLLGLELQPLGCPAHSQLL